MDPPLPSPFLQGTHLGTQGSTGLVPAPGSSSWMAGTPQGHKSQCVSAGRGWGLTGTLVPETRPRCTLPVCLPGRCRASRVGHSWVPSEPHGGAAAPRRSRCWSLGAAQSRIWLAQGSLGQAQRAAWAARPLHLEPQVPASLLPLSQPGAGRPPRIGWQCAPGMRVRLRQ